MNPPRPSLNFSDKPESEGGLPLRYNNNWIYQKNCYLCYAPLGYGQHRQRKLFCRICRRALCTKCCSATAVCRDKESLCKLCEKTGDTPRTSGEGGEEKEKIRFSVQPRFRQSIETRFTEVSPTTESVELSPVLSRNYEDRSDTVEDALRSAKGVLEDLRSKQTNLRKSHQTQLTQKSSALLSRFHAQLTDYDTELVEVKKQVGFYAEQLDTREQSIEAMGAKIQDLACSNSELEQRVTHLEQALGHLSEKGSEISSTPESKAETCVRCVLF